MTTLLTALLVAAAVAAAFLDLRDRRIPNWLTIGTFVLALAFRVPFGTDTLLAGLAGAGIAFAVSVLFFAVGGLGGGDVKLLTAVGAILGPDRLATALLTMALAGGVMAVLSIVRRSAYRETMANLHTIISTFSPRTFNGWKGHGHGAALTLDSPGAVAVPYGIAIAAGALAGWFLDPALFLQG